MALAVVGILAWAEVVHWRSGGRDVRSVGKEGGREAVVVLGFRNRGSRANLLNRYRVRAALRSQSPGASESLLVLCGGAVEAVVTEAEIMAQYARERGYVGPMALDRTSRTTWENIQNTIPLIEDAEIIKIVSNRSTQKKRASTSQG